MSCPPKRFAASNILVPAVEQTLFILFFCLCRCAPFFPFFEPAFNGCKPFSYLNGNIYFSSNRFISVVISAFSESMRAFKLLSSESIRMINFPSSASIFSSRRFISPCSAFSSGATMSCKCLFHLFINTHIRLSIEKG